jgi:putative ABC transport system substrate-binding protein
MQFNRLGRREFITLLAGAAVAPLDARAREPANPPIVGFLGSGTPSVQSRWTAAFVQRLHELGWTDGRNVVIEYRWAEGRSERFAEIAAEFVKLKVDLILAHNTPPVLAAKQATSTIPIVFATASDPVGTGVVTSLARPGGNVTGLSSQGPDTAGKRIELLREVVPNLRRLAILANAGNPYVRLAVSEGQDAIRHFGLESATFDIRRADDIVPAFERLQGRVDALYVAPDPLLFGNRNRINDLALAMRLPTMHTVREYVEAGGLMSYGPSWEDMWRRAAHYVDKILRGAKPADLPVEQPTKFEFIVNLRIAKALGLAFPPTVLARADEVIE